MKELKIKNDEATINGIIVNTAISKDGTNIHTEKVISTDSVVSKLFGKKDRKYEIGIILSVDDFKPISNEALTSSKDVLQTAMDENKDVVEEIKNRATKGLETYVKWFSGQDKIGEPIPFIPVYDGKTLKLNGYSIVEMDEPEMQEYFEKLSKDEKPRLGFKVGYTINYDKPDEKKTPGATSKT